MGNNVRVAAGAVLAVLALIAAAVFTVDEREVAVVTQFGKPVKKITEPGIQVRLPWPLQEVVRFDARSRVLEAPAAELLTSDKKNLVVEVFAVWRVDDPQLFLEAVGGTEAAEAQLGDLVISRVAAAIGSMEFNQLLSAGGGADLLPISVKNEVATAAKSRLGVEVLDVRLRHVGLPLQNEQSIYERMRAERLRIANQYRSEGEELATTIKAKADREAAEILAKAEREAAYITAEAEKDAARRYTEAYRADPALFELVGAMDAYRAALDHDTTVILDADSEFFRELKGSPP
ncbi:MAG: protease modulator HflC [Myxococcota bacterium]